MVKKCLYLTLICLTIACSSNTEKEKNSLYQQNSNAINNFVPEYQANVPNLDIPFGNYENHNFETFIVSGIVDSFNLKQGYWKIINTKTKFSYHGNFSNNLKEGWWKVFSDSILICAGNYEKNEKQGYWGYLQTGIKKTSKFANYKNDTLNGLAREFTIDSILIADGNIAKGLKNGYWKFYYLNGAMKEQGDYYDDYKSGWWKSYDENGQIVQEASYLRNEISGYTINYINGIAYEEGKQFNGKKRGIWKCYDTNGKQNKIEEHDDN